MHSNALVRLALVLLLILSPFFLNSARTEQTKTDKSASTDVAARERWEYLVVSNPNRTNYQPTDYPQMRKEEMGSFGVEAFVLEQHMDRLGTKGWELVSVAGTPNDPIFYFKRARQRR